MVECWPYFNNLPDKARIITTLIETYISVGVFPTENPAQPVSWSCLLHCGEIAFVYTVEKHRRKGLSKAVVETMTTKVLDANMTPYVLVKMGNSNAKKLFENVGFVEDVIDNNII